MANQKHEQFILLNRLENEFSIELKPGMVIVDDISEEERTFTEEMAENIEAQGQDIYCFNPCTICYSTEGHIYLSPMSHDFEKSLKHYGFIYKNFSVPISVIEYVKGLKNRWDHIREAVDDFQREALAEKCKAHSKTVKPLDDEFLKNCLEIPERGLTVEKQHGMMVYYPFIQNSLFREPDFKLIGKYYTSANITVFVNVDGKTYITKGRVSELREHGFRKRQMFVPMSHDEIMFWPFDKSKWKSISEAQNSISSD